MLRPASPRQLWERLRQHSGSHGDATPRDEGERGVRSPWQSWDAQATLSRAASEDQDSDSRALCDPADVRSSTEPAGRLGRWQNLFTRWTRRGRQSLKHPSTIEEIALQYEMEKFIEQIPDSHVNDRRGSVASSALMSQMSELDINPLLPAVSGTLSLHADEAHHPMINSPNQSEDVSVSLPPSTPIQQTHTETLCCARFCPSSQDSFKWLDDMPKRNENTPPVPCDVFRGLAVSRMLGEGPSLMENSQLEYTFGLSEPVQAPEIDIFLSHTWNSNRFFKYLTMLYFFNGRFSLIAAHCAALVTFATLLAIKELTPYGDVIPVFYVPMPGNVEEYPSGLPVCGPCFFVGCLVQVGSYLFGHHIFAFRPKYKKTVFLDKCCIHQTDDDLKKAGIEHVGGFVKQSKTMFVPFDDDYFERLWCTYEIAAFVRYRGSDVVNNLKFMPIKVAVFVFGISLAGFIGTTGFMFMVAVNDMLFKFWFEQNWLEYFAIWGTGGTLVFGVPKFIFCHLSVQSRRALDDKLSNFSVANAQVKFESDRQLIESSIVGWFGAVKVFDSVVQKVFPAIVRRSLGTERQALRFFDVLQENAGVLFLFIYDASLMAFPDKRRIARCVAMGLSSHIVIDPMFLFSLNMLAQYVIRAECGVYAKHAMRAAGVFILGLVYPAWFAFCISTPFWLIGIVTACLGIWVPFIFEA